MGIFSKRSASMSSGTRAERLEAERQRRTGGEQRSTSKSYRWIVPILGVVVGTGALVTALVPSGAVACSVGVGIQITPQIFVGSTNTPAPVTSPQVVRVGDTIVYGVDVFTNTATCAFNNGSVSITLPDGSAHSLATGVSLAPGGLQSFNAATILGSRYTVSDSDLTKNGAPADKIRAVTSTIGDELQTGDATASAFRDLLVIHPETSITKSAAPDHGPIPLDVTFTFVESNISTETGQSAADIKTWDAIAGSSVVVTDSDSGCSALSGPVSSDLDTTNLNPGATWTYTCTETFSTVGTFTDHATATGNTVFDGREAGTAASHGAPQDEASTNAVVTTTKKTPTLSTIPQPASGDVPQTLNDQATLSGLLNPVTSGVGAGTLTFNLYGPADPTCAGPALHTETVTASLGNGVYTTTGGPSESAVGTYVWLVSYSGDVNNNALPAPSCANGELVLLTTKATPTLSTIPQPASGVVPQTLNDQATLSGLVNPVTSGVGAGTLTFNLYGPADPTCAGPALHTETVTASLGNGVYTTTGGPSESAVGTYVWLVSYSGDAHNFAVPAPSCANGEQVLLTAPPANANLTPGYWKNHQYGKNGQPGTQPLLDQAPGIFLGTHQVTTFTEAKTILSGMGCGHDGAINCMAGMLLAAELNLANGGSTCIVTNGVIAQANALLELPDVLYHGFATYTHAHDAAAMLLHDLLSAYNIDGVPTC